MVKIEIKDYRTGSVIFEFEKENNTVKDTVIEAVKKRVNLSFANLRFADLYNANLRNANLYNADLHGANLHYANLRNANLYNADLHGANLHYANLRNANLHYANLRNANLTGAMLNGATLRYANIREANLRRAELSYADLHAADFGCANLSGADLFQANLSGADLFQANLDNVYIGCAILINANLFGAKNVPYIPLACPSDGAFIGWKKVHGHLVKLEIPEDAKRSSATTNKCRCDKAKVLAITDLDGKNPIAKIENASRAHHVTYKVGKMVYPDSFDENRWNECSHGIHFFINKEDAINY